MLVAYRCANAESADRWGLVGSSLLIYVGVCRWRIRTGANGANQLSERSGEDRSHAQTAKPLSMARTHKLMSEYA